jgi:hypothetical protein
VYVKSAPKAPKSTFARARPVLHTVAPQACVYSKVNLGLVKDNR